MSEKCIARRGGHRAEAKKLSVKICDLITIESDDYDVLRKYRNELLKQSEKICKLDEEIQDNIPLIDIEAEICGASDWSMTINNALDKSQIFLRRAEQTEGLRIDSHVKNVKLPTIELPKFNGSYLDWQNFWDLYESSVHNRRDLGNASKFHYLASQLTGEAAKLMIGFNYTDAEYSEAVELLKTTYGKPSYLIDAHLNAVLDLGSPGSSGQELSSFRSSYEGHLRAMKSLNANVEAAGFVFAAILLRKLPPSIRDNMNREGRKDNWDLESLRKAIEIEIGHLKATEPATFIEKPYRNHSGSSYDDMMRHKSATILATTATTTNRQCFLCKSTKHSAYHCDSFSSIEQRREHVKKMKLCFNCLREGHTSRDCKSISNCRKCQRRHHTAVCNVESSRGRERHSGDARGNYRTSDNEGGVRTSQHSISVEQESGSVNVSTLSEKSYNGSSPVLLPTALVTIVNKNGEIISSVRALIDIGSQRTFILRSILCNIDYEIVRKINLSISGFCSKMESDTYDVIRFNVLASDEIISVEAIIINALPDKISMTGREDVVKQLINRGIKLADPDTNKNSFGISLLIGADQYSKFVYTNTINNVTLIPSKFGSLLAGPINNGNNNSENIAVESVTVLKVATHDNLDAQLERFWNIDSVVEEQIDDNRLNDFRSCVRYENNHFIANLPWKPMHPELPNNYNLSFRRLKSLLVSLRKDSNMLEQYNNVIKEQLKNKFIERVDTNEKIVGKLHYIPHHCVIKSSSTTPVRIVFDCSSKLKRELPSLNDCLFSGPVLINEMVSILLRFRAFKYACVSDIMKAFLMVELGEDDRNVTRFLWPDDPNDNNSKINVYRFRVVLFGATCSQFLLNISIKVHLEKYQNKFVRDLERSLYVDNVLFSVDNEKDLIQFYNTSNTVLNEANFKLRSWATNCEKLNSIIPIDIKCKKMTNDENIDILGLLWNSSLDILSFKNYVIDGDIKDITKRFILSECSKIYDPLGILLPVTISSRILMQDLWKLKAGWDEQVDSDMHTRWLTLVQELNLCQKITIPRALNLNIVEVCVFSDASTKAYGAVIYLKNDTNVNFYIAKARVAPVKSVSLPHLELLGANVAAKLTKYTIDSLEGVCTIRSINIWTDSQIVLSWLKTSKFNKNYVQKRIINIKNLIPNASWNFVKGSENPADCLTRGISAGEFVKCNVWFKGPKWLDDNLSWPEPFTEFKDKIEPTSINVIKEDHTDLIDRKTNIENILTRFSSFNKMIRVICYILRFMNNVRLKLRGEDIQCHFRLSSSELFIAEKKIISAVQRAHFSNIFAYFERVNGNVIVPNVVRQLNIVIEDLTLKCKGRLCNSFLNSDAKFPILIPNDSYLCVLIINRFHLITFHGGVNMVLSALREKYWIARGRQRIKTIIRKCISCKRHQGRVLSPPDISPFPSYRVEINLPFSYTGVDYAGPLNVKLLNNNSVEKVYICLFTCMTTRAIHLELAEDMSGETFINAFRRFVSRRSCPSVMLSDNAGNFKYGSNYLYALYRLDNVHNSLSNFKVQWKFIPSRAPHFGGTWERLIGLTKSCLKKVLGTKLITNIEMQTILCEIECQLNNRPLTYVTDSVDEQPLTPSHLLCGRTIDSIALKGIDLDENFDPSYNSNNVLSERSIVLRTVMSHFWSRWKEEYLKSLRERDRNLIGKHFKLKIGNIVLISEDTPRSTWRLGKIVELFNSNDGNVRSVKLKTSTGMITRPIIKLINLEILANENKVVHDCIEDNGTDSRPPTRAAATKANFNIKRMS